VNEQVDIAVDLDAVPPPLPQIVTLRQFVASPLTPPPQIIGGKDFVDLAVGQQGRAFTKVVQEAESQLTMS